MTVSKLIDELKKMPQNAEIATHANNHTTNGPPNGTIRVSKFRTYWAKNAVVIGNFQKGFNFVNSKNEELIND